MRILRHHQTLLFFDRPLLISATDQLGAPWVCLLAEQSIAEDTYLSVPISKGRLSLLTSGGIGVREVFAGAETGEHYLGTAARGNIDSIETSQLPTGQSIDKWLPDADVFLDLARPADNKVVMEANERRRAIIHCTLAPPESLQDSKITAEHLSEAVRLFQRLVRHTYEGTIKASAVGAEIKESVESSRNYTLEVFAVSAGSFTLHMQTAEPVDLLGYANIARALHVLDQISFETEEPQLVVSRLAEQSAHTVTAYKDLLEFVTLTNTTFSYEWSMPAKKESTRAVILPRNAKPLYEAIISRSELGREELKLVGRFSKIDRQYNKWRLVADDGAKKYTGDSYVDLAGIVIGTVRYELLCEEVLEVEPVNKREHRRLYLKSLREL